MEPDLDYQEIITNNFIDVTQIFISGKNNL